MHRTFLHRTAAYWMSFIHCIIRSKLWRPLGVKNPHFNKFPSGLDLRILLHSPRPQSSLLFLQAAATWLTGEITAWISGCTGVPITPELPGEGMGGVLKHRVHTSAV